MRVSRMRIGLVVMLALVAGMWGCKKKEQKEELKATFESAEDNARMDNEASSIFGIAEGEYNERRMWGKVAGPSGNLPPCATVTFDSLNGMLTIEFYDQNGPNGNCLCNDGVYRRGIIKTYFSGTPKKKGFTINIVIDSASYYVNDNMHFGSFTAIYDSINQSGYRQWRFINNGFYVILADGSRLFREASHTFERIAGDTTISVLDDVYRITGYANGTNRKGVSYTSTITEPLIKARTCRWVSDGKIELQSAGNTLLVDFDPYNNQACDRVASVSINGGTPINFNMN